MIGVINSREFFCSNCDPALEKPMTAQEALLHLKEIHNLEQMGLRKFCWHETSERCVFELKLK